MLTALTLVLEIGASAAFAFWLASTDLLFGHSKGPPELLIASLFGAALAVGCAAANFFFALPTHGRTDETTARSHGGLWLRVISYLLLLPCVLILVAGYSELPGALKEIHRKRVARLTKQGPSAMPQLVRALDDLDPMVRWRVAEAIRRIGVPAPAAVPKLVQMVNNRGEFINGRMEAVQALGAMKASEREAIDALIQALDDDTLRVFAAQALGQIGRPAEPALRAALMDKRLMVRTASAGVLQRMGAQKVEVTPVGMADLSASLKDLTNQTGFKQAAALDRLEELGPAAAPAVPVLAWVLTNNQSSTAARLGAAGVLTAIGPKAAEAVPALILALSDKEPGVQQKAAETLQHLGPTASNAVPALVATMRDPDPGTRGWAVLAAGAIGTDAAQVVPVLLGLFHDPDANVRSAAVNVVGWEAEKLGPEARIAALRALLAQLDDSDPVVRGAVHTRIGGYVADVPAIMPELLKSAGSPNQKAQEVAEGMLTMYVEYRQTKRVVGPVTPELVAHFEAALSETNVFRRRNGVRMLALLGPEAKQSEPALLKALKDPDTDVAARAGEALKRIDPAAAARAGVK